MMLVIRDAQRAALQLDTDVRWYEGRLSQLYVSFAQAPAAQRQQWVREGVSRAKAAGLARADTGEVGADLGAFVLNFVAADAGGLGFFHEDAAAFGNVSAKESFAVRSQRIGRGQS
jgi:hypothetical protein